MDLQNMIKPRPLDKKETKQFEKFLKHMEKVVIPGAVAAIKERQKLAEEKRRELL